MLKSHDALATVIADEPRSLTAAFRGVTAKAGMIYREVGQFKASYAADQAIFPIRQDRWLLLAALAVAYLVIPAVGSEYWLRRS